MAKSKALLSRLFILSFLLMVIPIIVAPFVPLEPLKPAVENQLSSLLGRHVTVGSIHLNFFGGPYLDLNDVTAKEDPAFGDGNLLHANQVRAGFSALQFLRSRQIEINSLKIQAPELTFTRNPEGVWSWTTVGKPAETSTIRNNLQSSFSALSLWLLQNITGANIKQIVIEQASVRLLDKSAQASETLYRNVALETFIDRQSGNSHVTGRLHAQSDESSNTELLKAEMPYDLTIERNQGASIAVQGSVGPGVLESKNFSATDMKSAVDLKGSALALNQVEMNLYDGNMRGRLQLDLATQRFATEGEVQNLNLDQALATKLGMPGQISGHINAQFKLSGLMRKFQETVPTVTGDGHISSDDLFLASLNLSEQVAHALKLNQIGDMNPGTRLDGLKADFHIEHSTISTSNLHIAQLDGLGDATADQGWIQVEPAPALNFTASVYLSNEATAQVKTTSPLIGAAVAVLESNHRVAVPVNISGDLHHPNVVVDVKRLILGF